MRAQDAAGCVILDGHGQALLVHQTYGEQLWEVPGGVVAHGESAWEAAVRECREEIGVTPLDPELTGIYFRPASDSYVFIFRVTRFTGSLAPDGVEVDAVDWFPVDDLPWPVTSFAQQRLRDAADRQAGVHLRTERLEDRRLLGGEQPERP